MYLNVYFNSLPSKNSLSVCFKCKTLRLYICAFFFPEYRKLVCQQARGAGVLFFAHSASIFKFCPGTTACAFQAVPRLWERVTENTNQSNFFYISTLLVYWRHDGSQGMIKQIASATARKKCRNYKHLVENVRLSNQYYVSIFLPLDQSYLRKCALHRSEKYHMTLFSPTHLILTFDDGVVQVYNYSQMSQFSF